SKKYFERMVENAQKLSAKGVMVSAETMLNKRTFPYLESIHDHVVEMGCVRHEVHPMYPIDFASNLETLSLNEMQEGIERLLDHRDHSTWLLFGTLPFYPCNKDEKELDLLQRLYREKNVTVRNDPDGRSRLNVNIFSGEVIVTDFVDDEPSLGNIQNTPLQESYDRWMQTKTARSLNCHCPAVKCLGPNLLVKNTYYTNTDFTQRSANLSRY